MDFSLDSEHYSEFQVNIFSNDRDITKCQFLHDAEDDAKVMAIPWVFSENSWAKNKQHTTNLSDCSDRNNKRWNT